LVFAGEEAAHQGKIWQEAEPADLNGGYQLVLDIARQQTVFVQTRDEAVEIEMQGGLVRFHDLLGGKIGIPHMADLTLLDEIIKGAQRLVDRGGRVRPVQLVEVDPIVNPSLTPPM
jgi:hypothetical protein